MARIAYADPSTDVHLPGDTADVVAWMNEKGIPAIGLRRLLLHAPPVAEAWMRLSLAIRGDTRLEPRIKELAICRIALAFDLAYMWNEHAPCALDAGVTDDELARLGDWPSIDTLSGRERTALAVADDLVATPRLGDDRFEQATEHFDATELVELVSLIGFYHMVARVLGAFEPDLEPTTSLPMPSTS